VPTLHQVGAGIPDHLFCDKSPCAAPALHDIGAWFLFLPPCSPDVNPITITVAKRKALLRKAAARTQVPLWQAVGQARDLFTDKDCCNVFKAAGRQTDCLRHALG